MSNILPPGPVEYDEEGDPVPVPVEDYDLKALITLLETGRRKGFRIGPDIEVGRIRTRIVDLRQTEGMGGDAEPDEGAWASVGYKPESE